MNDAKTQLWKGRYEIERPLGRGGMSAVYVAKDHQVLSRRVVVKVLLEEMNEDAWVRQKFLQEMEALARIDHPGVVGVLDTGQTPDGKQFLVMQYIEGQPLREAIHSGGMALDRAAGLIRQIGLALAAAHDAGVWHRDLKPENIMLQRSGGEEYAKLIDFGIAGIQNSQFTGEKTKVAGSLTYMAPEQFAGNACAASDIYALAVVAYELVTGEPPYPSSSMTHLVADDQTMILPRVSRPELPEAAERAIIKGLAFHPEARQGSAREFAEQLCRALTDASAAAGAGRAAPGGLEMAHVLFADLVGYSLLPMDRQKQYLGELQSIARAAPRFREADKAGALISLPTGDGMALVFFGDPTAPARCAAEIAAGLKEKPHLKLRMGIHTGPVYRVADVNANANVAGGGINIAQRVMDCGDAGHILVSNTVAEVLAQLSEWAPCLCDLGEHEVKHGVKIHLYNLATAEAGNAERPSRLKGPAAPAKKGSMAAVAGIAAAVVLLAGAWAAWTTLRPKTPQAAATVAPAETLRLSYTVEGAPDDVAFRVRAQSPVYVYLLSYGKDGDKWTFNLLFPLKSGPAQRPALETLRLPEKGSYRSSGEGPRDIPYLVFSAAPVPEMEDLKLLRQVNGVAVVDQPERVAQVKTFLESHTSTASEQDGRIDVSGTDKVLAHEVRLGR